MSKFYELELVNTDERIFQAYGSVEVRDKAGDLIPMSEFKKIMPIIMDNAPVLLEKHSNRIVGKILNYQFVEKEGKPALLLTCKIFKGFKLYDEVWDKIKKGIYRGISVGGQLLEKPEIKMKDGQPTRLLTNIEGWEFSICDKPMNPEAEVIAVNSIAKSEDTPHVRDLGEVIAIFENQEDAEKYVNTHEGLEVHPTQSGKWAVLRPLSKGDVMTEDVEKTRSYEEWRSKYLNPDGSFKGGFDGCVNAMMHRPKNPLSRESAERLCAYIGRKAGKIKTSEVEVLAEYENEMLKGDSMSEEEKKVVDKQEDEEEKKPEEETKPEETPEEEEETKQEEETEEETPEQEPEQPKEDEIAELKARLSKIEEMLTSLMEKINTAEPEEQEEVEEANKTEEKPEKTASEVMKEEVKKALESILPDRPNVDIDNYDENSLAVKIAKGEVDWRIKV